MPDKRRHAKPYRRPFHTYPHHLTSHHKSPSSSLLPPPIFNKSPIPPLHLLPLPPKPSKAYRLPPPPQPSTTTTCSSPSQSSNSPLSIMPCCATPRYTPLPSQSSYPSQAHHQHPYKRAPAPAALTSPPNAAQTQMPSIRYSSWPLAPHGSISLLIPLLDSRCYDSSSTSWASRE